MAVIFDVNGLNQLRVLNEFVARDIAVFDFRRIDNKHMSFKVKPEDRGKVCSVLDRQGLAYSVHMLQPKPVILKALKRIGLLVGALVAVALWIIASGRLWHIEISGNERIDDLTIVRTLKDNGISVGSAMKFDGKKVENILLKMDDVAAVSARLVGTTLQVNIIESAVITPQPGSGDIVSLYDAEVTRIVVTSGSATVKIGEKVPFGKILIEGVEYDTEGNPLFTVPANGTVYGKVNFTFSEIVSTKALRRTGKSVTQTAIIFFGKKIGKSEGVEFPHEVKRTLSKVGNFLPIYAESTVYYELEEYELELEEMINSARDKAVNTLAINAGTSSIEITSNYTALTKGLYRINVHIEAEISIGGRSN